MDVLRFCLNTGSQWVMKVNSGPFAYIVSRVDHVSTVTGFWQAQTHVHLRNSNMVQAHMALIFL